MSNKTKLSRRKFIFAGAGAATAFGTYATMRGLRYPPVSFTPKPLPTEVAFNDYSVMVNGAIHIKGRAANANTPRFRAYTPSPSLKLIARKSATIKININNISDLSILNISKPEALKSEEKISNIERQLLLDVKMGEQITLRWQLPNLDEVKFAAIGDTGGCAELSWSMLRAKQLGCHFLLHLGDFNYTAGEYDNAVKLFHKSVLPVYITIGNHDFHNEGAIYSQFREQLGTLNNSFSIHNTRFVNLDTAADFFPASTGLRGGFFDQLAIDDRKYDDQVVFTHRPLSDPDASTDRTPSGINEVAWLTSMLNKINAKTLIAGHIHRSTIYSHQEIRQFIVGDGLATKEAVTLNDYSKILVGRVSQGRKVRYQWQPLSIPYEYLVSPTHLEGLQKHHTEQELARYLDAVPASARENPFKFSQGLL